MSTEVDDIVKNELLQGQCSCQISPISPSCGERRRIPSRTFIYPKKNNTVVNLVISERHDIKDDCIQSTSASEG